LTEALQVAAAGRYRVVRLLGRGAMGAVFLAEDLRLAREVAIKVLRPDLGEDPAFAGRFQREARMSARLDHANIIPIYGVEQHEDFQYFVMKYVRGHSLGELMADGPMSAERAVPILWQAACGLGHAHQRGVVHRDVKPSNLMIDEDERVVVTDFGISKALEAGTQYTSVGQIVGTPRYLSPEQAAGEAIDGRADQYSLAVLGYELLTGKLPLGATTVHALIYAHINEVPRPARALRPEIPVHVSDALARALSKSPDDRFASMENFATALWPERPVAAGRAPATASLKSAGPSGPSGSAVPDQTVVSGSTRRRRVWAGVAALAALTAAGLFSVSDRGRPAEGASIPDTVESAVPTAPTAAPPDSTQLSAKVQDSAVLPPEPPPAPEQRPVTPKRPAAAKRRPPAAADTTRAPPPAPAAPTAGYLTINALPYGTVSIDGVEIGDTPLVRYGVSPGEHTFTITREGYRTDSAKFTVTAGNETRMSRTLTKASP
jgi:serine/threonine-protein kinase